MKLLRITLLLFASITAFTVSAAPVSFPEVKDLPVQTNLPEVMTMADGTKVTTPAQWRARREEMKAILEHYELGHAPPPPGNVSGEDIQSHTALDGAANFRLVHLKFGPDEKLGFDIAVFTPAKGGPFPTIINPSFFMTPGVNFTNNPTVATNEITAPITTNSSTRPRFNFTAPVDPERAARGFTNLLNRGYAIVTYRYTQCGGGQSELPHKFILSRVSGLRLGRVARLGVGRVARGGLSGNANVRGQKRTDCARPFAARQNW